MTTDSRGLLVREATVEGHYLLTMAGLLDSSTYRTVRDRVIKAAIDQPDSVIIDITELTAPASSAWSVFTSARWHLTTWPEVPVALVCGHERGRHVLARNGITRYVAVYDSVAAAVKAIPRTPHPGRRRVLQQLSAEHASIKAARGFVTEWLTTWSQGEFVAAAGVVVTELVDNALRHADGAPALRLESDGETVTVAVQDSSSAMPARQEHSTGEMAPTGLAMVAAVSRVWGMTPLPDDKIVWAVIGTENRLS